MPKDQEIHELFAANVEALRVGLGWQKRRIADEAGIPRPEMSQILKGRRNITLKTANAIAQVFDVPLADFLTGRFEAERYLPNSRI